jgi:hypothetical protein
MSNQPTDDLMERMGRVALDIAGRNGRDDREPVDAGAASEAALVPSQEPPEDGCELDREAPRARPALLVASERCVQLAEVGL